MGALCMDKNYDVAVCGGGIAGIAAALAAARNGANTCLLEKEYALGGLATLGLIVIYLPLCDGDGVKMSGGIAEELLKNSVKYGPGDIAMAWINPDSTIEERMEKRYEVQYNAASFMISAEELLIENGVKILYDARLSGVNCENNEIKSVTIETKTGKQEIFAKAFIDATGDADICYFAGEDTVDDSTNRRTGWYFSYDGKDLVLREQTDPIFGKIPETSRLYSGTDIEDISNHCIDQRRMIIDNVKKLQKQGNKDIYPLIIPTYHGMRMTRRLVSEFEFSEDLHERVWFKDSIGMIGNWKKKSMRYSIPYRCIKGVKNNNLYAAGRCVSADKSGWDLTRVIPTCAVTGESAGTAAAIQALSGNQPEINELQSKLKENGVLLDSTLFAKTM